MSEQTKAPSYFVELDQWTEANIFVPLITSNEEDQPEEELSKGTLERVKLAIREKVLESYKNGIRAGLAKAATQPTRKERAYAPAKNR